MIFLSTLILLLLVMDPIGNVPLTQVVLQNIEPRRRRKIIMREMFFAIGVLVGALFMGPWLMHMLGLENIVLQLAGGIVLFLIAIHMIFPSEKSLAQPEDSEPMFVPIAVPLVAGPSAIATLLLLSSQHPDHMIEVLLALLTAWAITAVILVNSTRLGVWLGKKVLRAVERLMGMVLIMVATQMFLSGVRTFIREINVNHPKIVQFSQDQFRAPMELGMTLKTRLVQE
jgi:multiple antibiotic resistance protein